MSADRPRPGWSSDIWDEWRRSSLQVESAEDDGYVPGHHVCGVGGRPKPGHACYRRCRCGLWFTYTGSMWVPGRPSRRWLRDHGLGADPGAFWDFGSGPAGAGSVFGEFFAGRHWLRRFLLMLRRGG